MVFDVQSIYLRLCHFLHEILDNLKFIKHLNSSLKMNYKFSCGTWQSTLEGLIETSAMPVSKLYLGTLEIQINVPSLMYIKVKPQPWTVGRCFLIQWILKWNVNE